MKKLLLASLIAATSFSASADMLIGGDVEVNMWQQNQAVNGSDSGSDSALTFEASFEHFIPLIPNIKFGQSSVNADDIEYTKRDFTLYYEFLDNDLTSFDAGIGFSQFKDGRLNVAGLTWVNFEGPVPHAFAALEIGIPATPLFVFAKGTGIGYDDSHMYDTSIGLQYSIPMLAFDLEFQGGYRTHSIELKVDDINLNTKTEGIFIGVNIDF